MSERAKARKKRIVMRAVSVAAAAATVVALALFFHFVPFRSLLTGLELPARAEGEMRVHFLDVGEGDCTVVEFPEGDALVVDGGDGSFLHAEHVVRYLKGLGVSHLTLVATHTDCDHAGGLTQLFEAFEVDTLYLPVLDSPYRAFTNLKKAAAAADVGTRILTRYEVIARPSGAYCACVNPRSLDTEGDNDTSAVLYVSYQGVNILLGADITAARERLLMREYALAEGIFDCGEYLVRLDAVDILRVSHHGSAQSSCEGWLSFLDPEVAVISCGEDNRYGHPSQDAVERLARYSDELYRIDECGDIIVSVCGGTYSIQTLSE